jgi:hypothetical protein
LPLSDLSCFDCPHPLVPMTPSAITKAHVERIVKGFVTSDS